MNELENYKYLPHEEHSNFAIFGIGKPTQKQIEKKEKRQEKRAEAKAERKGLSLGGRLLNIANKTNPLFVVMRAGVLAGLRVNIFGISRKLYPGLLSSAEIKSKKIDPNYANNAKKLYEDKIKKIWLGLGGRSVSFEEQVKNGFNNPIFDTKKLKQARASMASFDGYSNAAGVDDGAIATALPYLSSMATILSSLSNNPFIKGSDEYNKTQSDIDSASKSGDLSLPKGADPDEINELIKAGEESQILGVPKNIFYIGVFVLITIGGIIIYKSNNKK